MDSTLAVILTPATAMELEKNLTALKPLLEGIDHKVVAVMGIISTEDYNWMIEVPELIFAEVPSDLPEKNKRSIGACLIPSNTKNILFTDSVDTLVSETIKKHNDFFIEPLIGAVGNKGRGFEEFEHKKLLHSTITKFNLDEETFKKRCCDEKGKINYITSNYFMTSVAVWELVGGFNLKVDFPYVEYCIRLQALGYTILPF